MIYWVHVPSPVCWRLQGQPLGEGARDWCQLALQRSHKCEKEGDADKVLVRADHSHPFSAGWGDGRVRKQGMKKGECFYFYFSYHYPTLLLTGNKLS